MYRRTDLTDEHRVALRTELRVFQTAVSRAEEDLRVQVALASDAGMSLREIADTLGLKSPNTARLWKAEGEQARQRRTAQP